MSREAKPYGQEMWEAFTEDNPGAAEYGGLSVRYRRRCDRGAEAVIAAYEEDRRRDAGAALSAVEAQLRQVWKLVSAMLGVTGTAGCDPMEDEGAFLADAASLDGDLMEGA
ncbi:MAG TPA: hypothetical protein VK599_22255 [Streptosporangiaceae bacterium]|nr:hypothetical protein [Streptosporangiaceae bacterium]